MTKAKMIRVLLLGLFPALPWLLPSVLWGQVTGVQGAAIYATATPAELELRAESLLGELSRAGEAGGLFEKAGRLLPVEDPASIELLIRAARLQFYAGELAQSRQSMKDAGWRALGQGKVVKAANAYADAALIALAQEDGPGAEKLVGIVKLLANWPGVTDRQRREILDRLG